MDTKKKTGTIKTKILGMNSIKVRGEIFRWNPVYKVYNSNKNYDQLKYKDIKIVGK
jgi:hypothetical protein